MGHKHILDTTKMFETDSDQSWNHMHPEQPFGHLVAGAVGNSSLVYPVENMPVDGVHYASHWNPAPRSNGFPSSSLSIEVPPYQTDASGPSHDPFLHQSTARSFPRAPENYAHHASSSSCGEQTFHGAEGGSVDVTMGDGRWPYKRKSPGVPAARESGSSSRYYNAGSSSDLSVSSFDIWQQKRITESHYTPFDCPDTGSGYRGNSLSIGSEAPLRNVRSRVAPDLDTNLRTHLSSTPHHLYSSGNPADHSGSVELMGQTSNAREWNHSHMPPAANGGNLLPDANLFSHEANHVIIGSSNASAPVGIGGYHNDFITGRTPMPQNLPGTADHFVRGVRSSHTQRSAANFRGASSSNLHLGHTSSSDEGLQMVTESFSSRHPRPLSTTGWRISDRSGRTRTSSDRHRSLSDEAALRDRLAYEGFMIVDRSALNGLNGSRNLIDQHRDMRLDVDSMSYEELLALGERIGSVSTGLSEAMISKCLTESIYCSSDQSQEEEEKCAICLEEYKHMDNVGTLKTCCHDFHVDCVRKWLLMKNLCPICKAAAAVSDLHIKDQST